MLHYLANFEYIDKRSHHKMDQVQERTVEAIEKLHGPIESVSSKSKKYYLK